jgi:hypothetical protein
MPATTVSAVLDDGPATGRRPTHRARAIARELRPATPHAFFDPAMTDNLPEAAARWLRHAIAPGTLLVEAVELQMHGEIKLGSWRSFTATEALVPHSGYVWAAATRVAGLRVSGFDSYASGAGQMHWRLGGVLPIQSAAGADITISALDRLAAESVLLPTALIGAKWTAGANRNSAVFAHHVDGRYGRPKVMIHVAPDGQLRRVSMERWGKPDGRRFALRHFEVCFNGESLTDGITLPLDMTAAWWTSGGRRDEFFRARVDEARFFVGGR